MVTLHAATCPNVRHLALPCFCLCLALRCVSLCTAATPDCLLHHANAHADTHAAGSYPPLAQPPSDALGRRTSGVTHFTHCTQGTAPSASASASGQVASIQANMRSGLAPLDVIIIIGNLRPFAVCTHVVRARLRPACPLLAATSLVSLGSLPRLTHHKVCNTIRS